MWGPAEDFRSTHDFSAKNSAVSRPLAYRPDIDGLRALAVLIVVLFHADVTGLGGGFVGVDIFFVLSGFLITCLLLEEWAGTGTVNLRHFYLRRCLRLVPALILLPILLVLSGAVGTFSHAYWTLAYLRLTNRPGGGASPAQAQVE